ncbi:MAG: hypothetical protein RR280_01490 [Bacteroidaceae bacterium]
MSQSNNRNGGNNHQKPKTPVHSQIIPAGHMPTVELRLETFDRMMGHTVEFLGGSLNSMPTTKATETLFDIASELTDKALAKYAK